MKKSTWNRSRRHMTFAAFGIFIVSLFFTASPADAARCSADANGNWSCSYQERDNLYICGIFPYPRHVRWQVPEGTPPAGGWPVAFFYNGTTSTGTNPFQGNVTDEFGQVFSPQILHELLDDPNGTGKKYAVFAPEPPASAVLLQFWHTNSVFPYSASCDASFLPDIFNEITGGSYGSASQYNMSKRYAYGISSGGYNTSRMAVTFNSGSANGNTWKALAIISASYATCTGPACTYIPTLPSNHPPTKFWHGTGDYTVPLITAELYHNALISAGKTSVMHIHNGGHELNATQLGASGVKAWFDAYN